MFVIKNFDPHAVQDYTAYECRSYRVRYCRQSEITLPVQTQSDCHEIMAAEIYLDEAFKDSVSDPIRVIHVRDCGRAFIENAHGKTIDTVRSYAMQPLRPAEHNQAAG